MDVVVDVDVGPVSLVPLLGRGELLEHLALVGVVAERGEAVGRQIHVGHVGLDRRHLARVEVELQALGLLPVPGALNGGANHGATNRAAVDLGQRRVLDVLEDVGDDFPGGVAGAVEDVVVVEGH